MAEEVQKSSEAQLCKKCRSFFGQVQTDFLCSKCFADEKKDRQEPKLQHAVVEEIQQPAPPAEEAKEIPPQEDVARCSKCQRKLGLTQFKCKCGESFCSRHRVPEDHSCQFDHRALGVKKIAESNPLVVARKIEEI